MTVMAHELPRQSVQINFNSPTATREWAVFNAPERDDVVGWVVSNVPTIDTFGSIVLFILKYEFKEAGGGCWNVTANYGYTPNYIEVSIDTTGGQTKILQSLSTIRAYNCISPVSSSITTFLSGTIDTDLTAINTDSTTIDTDLTALAAATAAATAAAAVGGVDPTVAGFVTACVTACNSVATDGTAVNATAGQVVTLEGQLVADGSAGNITATQTDSDNIGIQSAIAHTDSLLSAADQITAQAAATAATTAAGGGNAQTIAAAAAAQAAATAALAVANDCNALDTDIDTLHTDADTLAGMVASGSVPGANGIPNYKGAIGVNGQNIEGVEVPIPKFVLTINRKLKLSVISSAYQQTMFNLTGKTNNATFTLSWKGQTMTFSECTLLFRGFRSRQTSDDDLDVNYVLEASPSLGPDDDLHIGNSPQIEKLGWEYSWVNYRPNTSAGSLIRAPQAVYIERVMKPADFTLIGL